MAEIHLWFALATYDEHWFEVGAITEVASLLNWNVKSTQGKPPNVTEQIVVSTSCDIPFGAISPHCIIMAVVASSNSNEQSLAIGFCFDTLKIWSNP